MVEGHKLATAPSVLTLAPTGEIAPYDLAHAAVYLRLLDAEKAAADWREVAHVVLGLGPSVGEAKARRIYSSHLRRAHWLVDGGYREILTAPGEPEPEPEPER
ncbi:MAG: DNA -binding domain-containing protein [Caulobacteraceae bacterium]